MTKSSTVASIGEFLYPGICPQCRCKRSDFNLNTPKDLISNYHELMRNVCIYCLGYSVLPIPLVELGL